MNLGLTKSSMYCATVCWGWIHSQQQTQIALGWAGQGASGDGVHCASTSALAMAHAEKKSTFGR